MSPMLDLASENLVEPLAPRLQPPAALLTRADRARYYKEAEARALFEEAGFRDVRLHHRHGYFWTVIATKPISPTPRR
jgi:hypothetical protein